ncbi:MAG: VWA domain-containing protein [Gammaproteobacteria bacterium]
MFDFRWPWMGLLLLIPLAMWLLNRSRSYTSTDTQERKVTLLYPALHNLETAFKTRHPSLTLGTRAYYVLLALMWTGLTVAAMRPQWLEPHTEERTEGYDLMLAVDASHSMEALDFSVDGRQVSRMQVVKGVMGRFIEARQNDRVGLIIFGSRAFVLSPLTLDRLAVRQLLDDLVPRIAGDGTAMGDALGLGVKKLRERPPGSRVLVLIADGENTAGTIPPQLAAHMATYEGIRIYAIGVGSDQKEVPIVENGRLITRDDLGFDEAVMRNIAEMTGGAYFRATDTGALETIYRRIDELEKSKAESRTVMIPHPLYRWPLGLALAALLALGLFPGARLRRFTRSNSYG